MKTAGNVSRGGRGEIENLQKQGIASTGMKRAEVENGMKWQEMARITVFSCDKYEEYQYVTCAGKFRRGQVKTRPALSPNSVGSSAPHTPRGFGHTRKRVRPSARRCQRAPPQRHINLQIPPGISFRRFSQVVDEVQSWARSSLSIERKNPASPRHRYQHIE